MAERFGAKVDVGWLTFGLLVTAAVVLIAETLLHGRHQARAQDAGTARHITILQARPARAASLPHAKHAASADDSAKPHDPDAENAAQMADDAAAAGMTARSTN